MTSFEDLKARGRFWTAYLEQDKIWRPKEGPAKLIAEMDDSWRKNAARWLLRRAFEIEMCYALYEADRMYAPMMVVIGEVNGKPVERLDYNAHMGPTEGSMAELAYQDELEKRHSNPEAWLKQTPLYRALVGNAGQPVAEHPQG